MPGFHGTKLVHHPELHMLQHPARMMNGRQAGKMHPIAHPMFDALRSRHAQERNDYIHMMKARECKKVAGDSGYSTFDSLKLLGAENDAHYLDAFMSEGAKLRQLSEEADSKQRSRSASHASKASSKRNSLNVSDFKKTLLGSLRSSASDENLYESVEVIQYRKHIEAISRQNKVRSVPKTGHPLFDHLRVENVLKPRRNHHAGEHPQRRSDANNSDGGSPSQSSSGSGDEFDYARKPNTRFSRREVLQTTNEHPKKQTKETRHQKPSRHVPDAGSESDDDWLIPRPKICGGVRSRRTGATGLMRSSSHDESDSSSKSTGLR